MTANVKTIPPVPKALKGASTLSFFTRHNGSRTKIVMYIKLEVLETSYPTLARRDLVVSASIIL